MTTSGEMSGKPAKAGKTTRDRKRELDRKAQRVSRERTKRHIAQLEATVASFQQANPDARVQSLMDRLTQVTRERDNLLDILKSLQATIETHIDGNSSSDNRPSPSTPDKVHFPPPLCEPTVLGSNQPPEAHKTTSDSLSIDSCSQVFPDYAESQSLGQCSAPGSYNSVQPSLEDTLLFPEGPLQTTSPPLFRNSGGTHDVIFPQPVPPTCECMKHASGSPDSSLSLWRALNENLKDVSVLCLDPVTEVHEIEDALIHAIKEGWHSSRSTGPVSTLLEKLRVYDELIPKECGPVQRLATLSVGYIAMVHHSKNQSHLPRWLQAGPSQCLPHSIAIDFVYWPRVRERLVFFQHDYCADDFWRGAMSNTKVAWPFDFRDTYVHHSATGKFYLSSHFRQFILDLDNWNVTPEFLEKYPDIREDIEKDNVERLVGGELECSALGYGEGDRNWLL